MRFLNRRHAGHLLAQKLARYRHEPTGIVIALPRGGVPVGHEVAVTLGLPLDILLVRKLGLPGHEEFAMGAIAAGGVRAMNPDIGDVSVPPAALDAVVRREQQELARRDLLYRGTKPPLELNGRTVILVDDGLATGSSMRAALTVVRRQNPKRIVVAVPVGAPDVCETLRALADDLVCVAMPSPLRAVSIWYDSFDQVSDDEVRHLLADAQAPAAAPADAPVSAWM
jgi:predicted phosphoribosyltransferase